jgi:hypothetical protein
VAARLVSNLLLLIIGLLLVAAAPAFAPSTVGWLGLAAGCAVVVVILATFAVPGRGLIQRALDVLAVSGAGWTIVACRVFEQHTARRLAFASGWLFAALGTIGLILHEAAWEHAWRTRAEPGAPTSTDLGEPRFHAERRAVR